ncbi:MAG: hypothetical protein R3B41_03290 [Candidatus Doudnabacteria bacterium]
MRNEFYSDYPYVVQDSVSNLYTQVIQFLPNVIAALIVLLLGWVIGLFLGQLLNKALVSVGIDGLGDQLGLKQLSERSGRKIRISAIVQWVIKWFFILASIIAAADILGLNNVTDFFYQDVLGYAGHVIIAMVILLLGTLTANFLGDIVHGTVKAGGFDSARMLGALTRWVVVTFAIIAALSELQIAAEFLQYLFIALVTMIAIAGGLAFGLGGRDHARKILDHVESNLKRKSE